ncbi:hypothetical protein RN001_004846 [Aquatica leii]|uniref:Methionyl-tRNA formyltransferase, mitochondrial n=1 Tax=Aquatica leii TaxID=1421715 RepID=A0AAN7Q0F4_9COLE|nr:hypothetical protein RN001_004846 [Aquatica leii]
MKIVNGIKKLIGNKHFSQYLHHINNHDVKPPWKIMFYGTDDFSVASLNALCNEYRRGSLINQLEVVTAQKVKISPVMKYAAKENLVIHSWPVNPSECKRFHIGIVVSFGYLIPENIIQSFSMGMINVHASLLPRWRGAAPIIYALANGDKETGVTIMNIKPRKYDIGEIISQATVKILPEDRLPQLLTKLATAGANELLKVLKDLSNYLKHAKAQPQEGVTFAPKITSKNAIVTWTKLSSTSVINLDKALTGLYPLMTTFSDSPLKLYNVSTSASGNVSDGEIFPGTIRYCKESQIIEIQCADGKWIRVKHVGVPGKKMMTATDFNNGFLSKKLKHLRICR